MFDLQKEKCRDMINFQKIPFVKVFKEKVRLSRRFNVFSIHLSTKHNDQSPICVWCIHPVPKFTNLVIAVPISQKINLVELIVGRTSMKSALVTRELRDHILVTIWNDETISICRI